MKDKAMSKVIYMCCDKKVSISSVMEHRLTEECLSLFDTNGSMVKVQKSKLTEKLNFSPLPYSQLMNSIAIIDMGFIWRLAAPTTEDRERK